jgi:hypothetical protein
MDSVRVLDEKQTSYMLERQGVHRNSHFPVSTLKEGQAIVASYMMDGISGVVVIIIF